MIIMRFLHTSDWHLGLCLHGASLLEEQKQAVAMLAQAAQDSRADAVVLAGDLFDHAVARPEAIALYNELMRTLCDECGITVLAIAGNHDGAARLSACGDLLRQAGLFVSGALKTAFEPVVVQDTAFFLLPWFHNDQVRALFPDAEIRTTADAMATVCAHIRARFQPGRRHVLVAHCFAAGGQTTESDRTAELGGAGRIPTEIFAGFDYVALGHLHRAQSLAPNLRYSGTPYPYSFSEAGQAKTFTLVDTADMQIAELPAMPQDARQVRIVAGEFDALCAAAPFDARQADYLCARLHDATASAQRLAALREHYPNLLLLEGCAPETGGDSNSLTMQDLAELTPRALVTRFCEEMDGQPPDDTLLDWFESALTAQDEEVAQ